MATLGKDLWTRLRPASGLCLYWSVPVRPQSGLGSGVTPTFPTTSLSLSPPSSGVSLPSLASGWSKCQLVGTVQVQPCDILNWTQPGAPPPGRANALRSSPRLSAFLDALEEPNRRLKSHKREVPQGRRRHRQAAEELVNPMRIPRVVPPSSYRQM